ncbi:MAG: ADP-ribosylglycohydrolase family protein [Rickettsiales bacterium]|nr:ADP-ribosylglycohydrolase family protein [Rickettsiales bacterium]
MLGAIIGDIIGSRFEWNNIKTKDFELFHPSCDFTDDSVLTIAVAKALLTSREDFSDLTDNTVKFLQEFGNNYPNRGYGVHFLGWLNADEPLPYNSWGNGSAMRVSACGWIGKDLEEVKRLSRLVTEVSHNHPEGIKGAEATAVAIFLARNGAEIDEIRDVMMANYYNVDFTLDEIRPNYRFDVSCQGSVPQALVAFFESTDFEDAIRNAISIGGDSDTIAAITGSIAETYYGIPEEIKQQGLNFLTDELQTVLREFNEKISL